LVTCVDVDHPSIIHPRAVDDVPGNTRDATREGAAPRVAPAKRRAPCRNIARQDLARREVAP
jgi:hypothetical protein